MLPQGTIEPIERPVARRRRRRHEDGGPIEHPVRKAKRSFEIYVKIVKSSTDEERTVTGVVLVPDVVDAQGDKVSAATIRKAALDFGVRLNKGREFRTATKTGVQHNSFAASDDIRIAFTWIAPMDIPGGVIGDEPIPTGSWIVTAVVFNDAVWQKIKKGQLTGWSIGGKSKALRTNDGLKVAQKAEDSEVPYYQAAVEAVRSAKSSSQAE